MTNNDPFGPKMYLEEDDLRAELLLQSSQIAPYPFSRFPDSYVKSALDEGKDWRKDPRGPVTSVKDQGPHGYCGTFGRIESAEGQYALRSGMPARNFSVEQMVDCVGWANDQTPSIIGLPGAETRGLMAWEDYPY